MTSAQNHNIPAPQSPLMEPIQWQGETYFSSQYFHQQYLVNSPHGGKYRRHGDFLRLLRSIEAYSTYVTQEDIVELEWNRIKTEGTQISLSFYPVFQAAGWNLLTLLNSTAQVALSHHLDDELSKQMSVAANTTVARQTTRKTGELLPAERAARELDAFLQIGKLLKTPEHIVQQEAAKQIEIATGVNLRPFLLAAPAQNDIKPDDMMLEPTDLGQKLGIGTGRAMNMLLEQIGWQIRVNGQWEPTTTGEPYSSAHAWTAEHGSKHGYNLRWKIGAVRQALKDAGVIV